MACRNTDHDEQGIGPASGSQGFVMRAAYHDGQTPCSGWVVMDLT
jgi:hypothetical protein